MQILPNYKKIYSDLLKTKYPEKIKSCESILNKEILHGMDIVKIEKIINGFQDFETYIFNQKHKVYSKSVIFEILNYQKNNELNNSQLAIHFQLSRNTVAKWRKLYL